MDTFISYIGNSLLLLTLGAALGSILVAAFLKSCSSIGLLPVRDGAARWDRVLEHLD